MIEGCNKFIQAQNVFRNKSFKAFLREQYCMLLTTGIHEYTTAGFLKRVPRRRVAEWLCGLIKFFLIFSIFF